MYRRSRKKYLVICSIIFGIIIYINIRNGLNKRLVSLKNKESIIKKNNKSNKNSNNLNNNVDSFDDNYLENYDISENDSKPEINEKQNIVKSNEEDIDFNEYNYESNSNYKNEIDYERSYNKEDEVNKINVSDESPEENDENENAENINDIILDNFGEIDNEEIDNEKIGNIILDNFKSFIEVVDNSSNDNKIDNDLLNNIGVNDNLLDNAGVNNNLLQKDEVDDYLLNNIDVVNDILGKMEESKNSVDNNNNEPLKNNNELLKNDIEEVNDESEDNIAFIDENIFIGEEKTYIRDKEFEKNQDTINNINDDTSDSDEVIDVDADTIKNYKGGELEPEWEWAKSISVVYTWVDGNDVDFLEEKSKYNGGFKEFNSRDRSADELRYSIRSLEQYMPWHNGTIYIVTNNQIPKWLDTSNPRIKMVYHREFIPEYYLPTYDSNVIELFLDKIPGITEYFLYFNDDIFLNNYIHPSFYFTSKTFYPKVYRSYIVDLNKKLVEKIIRRNNVREIFYASKYFTREILRKYFDPSFEYRYLLHTVYVIYRDLMEPFRQLFRKEIRLICSDKFRNPYEPHSLYLYQTYLYYATQHKEFPLKLGGNGKASQFIGYPLPQIKDRTVKTYSVEMVPEKISKQYIKFGSVTDNYDYNLKLFKNFRKNNNLLVYNFNDEYSENSSLYQFTEYMISRYPKPSSFEKKEYIDMELAIQPLFKRIDDLTKTINEEIPENYDKNKISDMKETLKQYELDVVSEYIDNKNSLSDPPKKISEKEEEEITFLLSYDPSEGLLDVEWEWATKISIVYYLEKRKRDAKSDSIVTEEEKLRYSLRSIKKYLPWFRGKIFIITQIKPTRKNKILSWLDRYDRHIKVIHQNDILPKFCRSTRNRHVVEMFLDRIPKISEKFIYMKSNQYFIRYTHPQFFFSIDQYPKFFFKAPIPNDKVQYLEEKDKAFYRTHELIKTYFGDCYFRSYRYLYNAPIALYRDIFTPVRILFKTEIKKYLSNVTRSVDDLLPMYLLTNYVMYGTSQPFYPFYVAGYGKIREVSPPAINPNRYVYFYGYDIPSRLANKNTAFLEIPFTTDTEANEKKIEEINRKMDYELFISFHFYSPSKFTPEVKKQYIDYMEKFFSKKSSHEF
ncbi:hypothetical protein PIROE2DRAFT_9469 [Piromyces sp. E2]|nr:hypothetical protein PIROE2DRAFT_9469 [Piromyces sp. E2]|eukprot:OUM63937.1 hypothetical protein PIROE2DRAFT_9469 [Piromyces sp. E2]